MVSIADGIFLTLLGNPFTDPAPIGQIHILARTGLTISKGLSGSGKGRTTSVVRTIPYAPIQNVFTLCQGYPGS